jgi:hypothetical protein
VNGAPELICWSIGFGDDTGDETLLLLVPDEIDGPADSEVVALGDMLAGELENDEVRLQR